MQRMSVWFVSAYDQPKGRSSRTYDFAKELVRRGHQVTFFTNSYCHWAHVDILNPGEKWRIEMIDGIRVIWLKTTPYEGNGWQRAVNMLSNAWRSMQVARTLPDKPDVVIGPSVPLATGWAASRIAKLKKAAFIFEVREVWPIRLVYDGALSEKSIIYYLFRTLEKHLYRKSHKISTVLPFIHDHVTKSGSDPQKITWLPNGVNFERFSGFDHYDGGKKDSLTVMYVGGISVGQDITTIIKAARLLQERGNKKYRFVIVGDGPNRQEREQEALDYGLSNIEFRGAVPKSEIPRIQMEADILVVAVLDSKAYQFGVNFNKLYDYFSSARPILFSGNVPNNQVLESNSGFSISPENPNAMVEVLEQFQEMTLSERVNMGKRGRDYVEKEFDIKILTMRMESLFLDAIKIKEATHAT